MDLSRSKKKTLFKFMVMNLLISDAYGLSRYIKCILIDRNEFWIKK